VAQPAAQQPFEAGAAALDASNWREAADQFANAVALDPNFEVAQYYLGLSLFRLDDWTGAEEALQKAIALREERAGSRLALANAFLGEGRWQEAAAAVKQEVALQAPATRAEAMYVLGLAYKAGGDVQGALRQFAAALEEDPNFVDVRFDLGELWNSQRQYRQALDEFLKAQELIENWKEDLRSALATLVEGKRKADITEEMVEERYRSMDRFVNKKGMWPEVNKALGDASRQLGEYEDARNHFRDALKRSQNGNPHDTDALTRIGTSYAEQAAAQISQGAIFRPGHYLKAAEEQFQRVLDVDPGYAPALEGIGLAYLTDARIHRESLTAAPAGHTVRDAEEMLLLALQADPDYVPAKLSLGEVYLFDNRAEEALKEFEEAFGLAQKVGEPASAATAQTDISKAKAVLGDAEGARQAAESVLAENPQSLDARVAYARSLYLLGRYDDAAKEAAKALDISSQDLEARILLGDIFYAQEFWAVATSTYQQALDLIKESVSQEATKQRADLYRKMGDSSLARGDYSTALTFLNKSLVDDPSNYQAERTLAKTYWANREYAAAKKALKIAALLSPSSAEEADALVEMGALLEATGDLHEAYLNYTNAFSLDPTNTKAQEALNRLGPK